MLPDIYDLSDIEDECINCETIQFILSNIFISMRTILYKHQNKSKCKFGEITSTTPTLLSP